MQDQTGAQRFTEFVAENGARLKLALVAHLGPEIGDEAAAEALAYGWEHWERVGVMSNPTGYLYVVGRDRGHRMRKARAVCVPGLADAAAPWVEPALVGALAALTERERVVVLLLHCHGLPMSRVAVLLGVSKSTVQTHAERAMKTLRRKLGVGC